MPDVYLIPLMVLVQLGLVLLTVHTFYLLLVGFIGYFIKLPFSFLRLLSTWLQLDFFMNTSNCPGLDMNGFAMPELSLKKLCSFPFYHTFSYPAFCCAFCQFALPGFPAHRFLDDL